MSSLSVPAFDLLSGQFTPCNSFGIYYAAEGEKLTRFRSTINGARGRIVEGFSCQFQSSGTTDRTLDEIVDQMWKEGWDPHSNDVNLFTTDFGLVLTEQILLTYGGTIILRSTENLNHLSVHWAEVGIEAFPFHKVLKCLFNRDGESLASFVSGLSHHVMPL